MPKQNVLVICAHSDDQILGPGGTLAKYAQQGKGIYTIVLSYGEASHIWYKRKVAVSIRKQESIEADKVIGGKEVRFFDLKEGKFREGATPAVMRELKRYIARIRPEKIFAHSPNDPHVDHRAAYRIVRDIFDGLGLQADLYAFDIWSPFHILQRDAPKMYVDITQTFPVKRQALACFRSQKMAMLNLGWSVYARAIINGIIAHAGYAERFVKVR
ncbi:MAG TPA: PIG-L family deacetylase [Candidatus Nanoarchaeia archaeon]|nr:PIG-L family deacetylase [Candidatus Nanoarchaeia archaeon]